MTTKKAASKVQTSHPRNLAHIGRDSGYRFIDRDPVLEEITRAITDSGRSLAWVAERSGVSRSTIYRWENGRTRRPQNLTVEFVLKVLGYERIVRKMR
jgi:transcriptional regulator with XRE-family HTH domain